jgi:hypothetical protein
MSSHFIKMDGWYCASPRAPEAEEDCVRALVVQVAASPRSEEPEPPETKEGGHGLLARVPVLRFIWDFSQKRGFESLSRTLAGRGEDCAPRRSLPEATPEA